MKTIEWAAGLFEGEGSIVRDKRCNSYQLTVSMKDKDVLDDFAEVVGVGNVKYKFPPSHQLKENWEPFYRWTASKREDVIRILDGMLPYLGHRRAHKALDALDLLECTT